MEVKFITIIPVGMLKKMFVDVKKIHVHFYCLNIGLMPRAFFFREDDDHYAVLWFIVYFVLGFVIFKVCHKCLYLPCFDRFFDYLDESYRANHNNIVLNSGRRGRDQVVVRYSRSEHVIVDNLYPGDSIQSPRSRPVNVDNGPQREQPGAEKDDTKNRQVNCDGYSKLLDEVD